MTTTPKGAHTTPRTAAASDARSVQARKPSAPKTTGLRKTTIAVATKPKPFAPEAAALPLAKSAKAKKPKLVRDSFTIPKAEYTVLENLKLRTISWAHPAKKSELLRAGIMALAAMSDAALREALQAVPTIKTGRPAAEKPATPAVEKTVKRTVKKA